MKERDKKSIKKKNLTIAIFGGSGATGKIIVSNLIKRGIAVRGLFRKRKDTYDPHKRLVQIIGPLDNQNALCKTLLGADAVIIVFGPRPPYREIFCAASTRNILKLMHKAKISRIICQTGAMIGDYPQNRSLPFKIMTEAYNAKMPHFKKDRAEQERMIKLSKLNWTLVKPPRLTNRPGGKHLLADENLKVGLISSISREDLAKFMVGIIGEKKYFNKAIFIKSF